MHIVVAAALVASLTATTALAQGDQASFEKCTSDWTSCIGSKDPNGGTANQASCQSTASTCCENTYNTCRSSIGADSDACYKKASDCYTGTGNTVPSGLAGPPSQTQGAPSFANETPQPTQSQGSAPADGFQQAFEKCNGDWVTCKGQKDPNGLSANQAQCQATASTCCKDTFDKCKSTPGANVGGCSKLASTCYTGTDNTVPPEVSNPQTQQSNTQPPSNQSGPKSKWPSPSHTVVKPKPMTPKITPGANKPKQPPAQQQPTGDASSALPPAPSTGSNTTTSTNVPPPPGYTGGSSRLQQSAAALVSVLLVCAYMI